MSMGGGRHNNVFGDCSVITEVESGDGSFCNLVRR